MRCTSRRNAEGPLGVVEAEVEARGLFGSYARALGWDQGRAGGAENDTTMQLRLSLDSSKKPDA